MYKLFDPERARSTCILCRRPAMFGNSSDSRSFTYICGSCGTYRVTEEFTWELPQEDNPASNNFYKISSAFRQASENITAPIDVQVRKRDEIKALLEVADPSVQDKLTSLLIWLGKNCENPGRLAEFDFTNDYTLFFGRDEEEAIFLIRSLAGQGYVLLEDPTLSSTSVDYKLSAAGWLELARLTQSGSESSNGFIAMWFDQSREPYEVAINEAIRNAGYSPVRIDRIEHLNRIDDEIIARIRSSKFLVADFTGQRNGVYFEAGFMVGLGRPVFWVCEGSDLKNVHFDTRQYNTINYTDPDDLKKRLQFRIEAIIGGGPHKKS